ncbi:MAG TPA: transposase zinc-binding domain-containing protein [Myxococcota bacterium]|nr:transposase zinc-binding domain-containing protein [Myxococcota bacterium]
MRDSAARSSRARPSARRASCGYDFLVPFSCKTRGLCPSCNTRRMMETAEHWYHMVRA